MLLIKVMLAAVASVTLVLGVCEGDDTPDETSETRALEQAVIFHGDRLADIPFTDQTYDCIINVAIEPEPPASPLRDVAGRCIWTVEPQGSAWVVTVRETWFCSDWNAEIAGYPPCSGLTGFHEWQYFVDLQTNSTNLLDDSGQFAPDMAP
jgi:hypothetical protein